MSTVTTENPNTQYSSLEETDERGPEHFSVLHVLRPCGTIAQVSVATAINSKIYSHDALGNKMQWRISPMYEHRYIFYKDTCKDRTLSDGTVVNEWDVYHSWWKQIKAGAAPTPFPREWLSDVARVRAGNRKRGGRPVTLPVWHTVDPSDVSEAPSVKKGKKSDV